ncbi:hypothetical protein B0H63DRAFT_557871 [Podospora didyma]|uniref:Uncharacterized protein n=1 Tax=Podospora didyma TaxID=330526 RepID=A0AAE0U560_9PEZI|nr:hypothetical protein B0H63DRAFT_557871 [Podospora didyma]
MFPGRQVLLSAAVLSGFALDTVSGGLVGHRDVSLNNTLQTTSAESVASALSLSSAVPSLAAPVQLTVSVASAPTASPASVDVVVVTKSGGSLGAAVIRTASPPGSDDDYVYPGVYDSGGTLTTDVNAPTRTVVPTRISVVPNPKSPILGPPPMDMPVEIPESTFNFEPVASSVATAPPANPGWTFGPGEAGTLAPATTTTAASTTAAAAGAVTTTPPRVPPLLPPKISSISIFVSSSGQIGLGDTSSPSPLSGTDLAWQAGPSSGGSGQSFSLSGSPSRTTLVTSTRYSNQTWISSAPYSSSITYCQASDSALTVFTSWSIVHTSTITWYGNPSDYTQPFAPIETPTPPAPCVEPLSPPRMTISVCSSTGTNSKYVTCTVTTSTASFGYGIQTSETVRPLPTNTITFLTTDKNPAVIFKTIETPNYGVTEEPKTRDNHASPTSGPGPITTPAYNSPVSSLAAHAAPPTSPVTVVVQPTAVVINGNTITDNPIVKTQVVVISSQTFTIDPTRVIGAGATVDRPAATGGYYTPLPPPPPTTTSLAGLAVVVSSSAAVIAGTTFKIEDKPATVTVSGQTFTIGPSGIAAAGQTLAIPAASPSPTEVVVVGGELITAIGQSVVVIKGTTITYGNSGASTATVIDQDTITLGPGGITAHDTTIGGTTAKSTETQFAVVGGATITKIGPSVVVINNVTYTVGPGTGTTTTVIGNETITIQPSGVSVSTLSFDFPFGPGSGPTTTIVPSAAGAASSSQPTVTSTSAAAVQDAAADVRPNRAMLIFSALLSIAIGVMALG